MKKIISFSLWGDNPIYTQGAIRNAELAKEVYPDWVCREPNPPFAAYPRASRLLSC